MKKVGAGAKKPAIGAEEICTALLDALRRAGLEGVKAAGLRLSGKSPAAAARVAALHALLANGSVQMLGSITVGNPKARFFLAQNTPTAETVAARLLELGSVLPDVPDTPVRLWSEVELSRRLPAHEHSLLALALGHLYAKRQAVPFCQGRKPFVAFAKPLRAWLGSDVPDALTKVLLSTAAPAENTSVPDDATLFRSYAQLVRESGGFPDVKIASLRRAVGNAPLAARLIALWREGRATLSLGDWSLADEATRAAAVALDGEKYLLVRLDE